MFLIVHRENREDFLKTAIFPDCQRNKNFSDKLNKKGELSGRGNKHKYI